MSAAERSLNELWVSTKAARGVVPESVKPMGIWSRLGKAQEGKNKTKGIHHKTYLWILPGYLSFPARKRKTIIPRIEKLISGLGIYKQLRQVLGLGSVLFVSNHEA